MTRLDRYIPDEETHIRRENDLETALAQCVEALRLTREYVGPHILPAKPGWTWYDASVNAKSVLGYDPTER